MIDQEQLYEMIKSPEESWHTKGFLLGYLPLVIDEDTLAGNNRSVQLQLASLQFYSSKEDTPT